MISMIETSRNGITMLQVPVVAVSPVPEVFGVCEGDDVRFWGLSRTRLPILQVTPVSFTVELTPLTVNLVALK